MFGQEKNQSKSTQETVNNSFLMIHCVLENDVVDERILISKKNVYRGYRL